MLSIFTIKGHIMLYLLFGYCCAEGLVGWGINVKVDQVFGCEVFVTLRWLYLVECFTYLRLFWFVVFWFFFHEFEVTFFTAADEAFTVSFEFIPAVADVFCFIIGDGVILGS